MKNIILVLIFLGQLNTCFAQEVVSSAGQTNKTDNYEISWILGELVIETASSNQNILTQGFEQSNLIVSAISQIEMQGINLKVYPNPTTSFVTIDVDKDLNDAFYTVFDNNGRMIQKDQLSGMETKLDFTSKSSGKYILRISQGNTPIQTFKVIKK